MKKNKIRWHRHVQKAPGKFSAWMAIGHGGKARVHKSACCDCGLAHDEQYRVLFVSAVVRQLDGRTIRIEKRVRRNEKVTAALRRK